MLVLLSPAKSMCAYRATQFVATCPVLLEKTDILLSVMKGKTKGDLKSVHILRSQAMMSISDDIAALNYDRYQCFINNEAGAVEDAVLDCNKHSPSTTSASVSKRNLNNFKITAFVFDGPAYRGLDAISFTPQQYDYAQQHVRILSGLYGVLRPGDLIQEYRLEMGTKLAVKEMRTLYEYWGDHITDNLLSDLMTQSQNNLMGKMKNNINQNKIQNNELNIEINANNKNLFQKTNRKFCKNNEENVNLFDSDNINQGSVKVVVNLASAEYFKSVKVKRLCEVGGVRVVECVFKDKGRVTSVYAKRARGLMARFIVTEGINIGASNIDNDGSGDKNNNNNNNESIDNEIITEDDINDKKKRNNNKITKMKTEERITNNNNDDNNEKVFQDVLNKIKLFDIEGYTYVPSQSTDSCIVFNRVSAPPPTSSSSTESEERKGEEEERKGEEEERKGEEERGEKESLIVVEEGNGNGKGKGKGKRKEIEKVSDETLKSKPNKVTKRKDKSDTEDKVEDKVEVEVEVDKTITVASITSAKKRKINKNIKVENENEKGKGVGKKKKNEVTDRNKMKKEVVPSASRSSARLAKE